VTRIGRHHPAVGEDGRGIDPCRRRRQRDRIAIIARDQERLVDSAADQIMASGGERNRVDRRGVGDRANELAAGDRIDLHRVAPGDRGSVAGGSHRGRRGEVVSLDIGHARQLREQVAARGVPDAGAMVPAAERDEPLIGLEALPGVALHADRRPGRHDSLLPC